MTHDGPRCMFRHGHHLPSMRSRGDQLNYLNPGIDPAKKYGTKLLNSVI